MNGCAEGGESRDRLKAFELRRLIKSRLLHIEAGDGDMCLSFEYDDGIPEVLMGKERDLRELVAVLLRYSWECFGQGGLEVAVEGFGETYESIKVQFSFCENLEANEATSSFLRQRLFLKAEDDGSEVRSMNEICARLGTELVFLTGPRGERFIAFVVSLRKPPQLPADPQGNFPGNCLRGKRLLLVEDNDLYREVLKGHFVRWGMEVEDVGDAERAIEVIDRSVPFDFGVFDSSLPGITGNDLARYCRGRRHRNCMKIISLVGSRMPENGHLFDCSLAKPAMPSLLKDMLYRYSSGLSGIGRRF